MSRRRLILAILSVGGIGFLRRGPATAGTIAGAMTFMALQPSLGRRVAMLAVAAWAGQAGTMAVASAGEADPQFIVIDEVAGVWLALVAVPSTALNCLVGAAVFRLLDKRKPGIIGAIDRNGGRWSVMGDDLAAGLATSLILGGGRVFLERI